MATLTDTPIETLADLLDRLGDIPLNRIRFKPAPGTATEADVIDAQDHQDRLCELVDGVLVEKTGGLRESLLAIALAGLLRAFVVPRNLGIVLGADGTMKFQAGLVRIPDVSFLSSARFPDGQILHAPIPLVAPDLAVEVLSPSNTRREMARKRREYFEAETILVWEVDPKARQVDVYTGPEESIMLGGGDTLDGGTVLPGFRVAVGDIFSELDRQRG